MRCHPALVAAALLALLAGAPARALPPIDFCETNPSSPLCNPDDPPIDPTDPCEENPQLCEPPDPCVADPASCEPPDPCELDPAACEPADPCVADPASCEPEPEPEPPASFAALTGSGRVKGRGFKAKVDLALDLSVDGQLFALLESGGCGDAFQGQLVPKGKKGKKLQLFLDERSGDAFAALVAAQAGEARGASVGAPLGDSTRLVLKRGDDGSVSLKVKSEVLFEDGEVVLKASLAGVLTEGKAAPPPGGGALCP